jgi:hypothetical protein
MMNILDAQAHASFWIVLDQWHADLVPVNAAEALRGRRVWVPQ